MRLTNTLLVEDEPDISLIVEMILARSNRFSLKRFTSAEHVLGSPKELSSDYDLMILDYRLPGMSGIELLQALRRFPSFSAVPAILLSASISVRERAKYDMSDFVGIIEKPFNVTTLVEEITVLAKLNET